MGKKKKQEKNEEIETLYDDVPKKKLHLERKFWLFILLLFIGTGLAFGGTMFGIMKESKADSKKETTEIKEDAAKSITDCEPAEPTIDREIALLLDRNIEILGYTTDDLFDAKATIFEKNLKNSELSEVLKLNSILWYADYELDEAELSLSELKRVYGQLNDGEVIPKDYSEEDIEDEYTAYNYSDINKLFKSVYGHDIKDTKNTIKEPKYVYDKSSKKFIYKADALDEEPESDEDEEEDEDEISDDEQLEYFLTYKYKYETNEKNIYVYLSLAYIDDANDNYTLVYKDYNKKELYQKLNEEEYEDFDVDRFNYNDFSKYKITFTKSGNDYIFESIESIK